MDDEDISPVYPHAPDDRARQSLVAEHFLVALVQQIIHPQNRRDVPRDVVRRAGVNVLVAGLRVTPKVKSASCRSPTKLPPATNDQRFGVNASETDPELRGRRTSGSPMPVSEDSGVVDAVMRVSSSM